MPLRLTRVFRLHGPTFLVFLIAVPRSFADSPWIEIQSPHFSVITDAGERRGKDVAVRFEQMRSVFGALMTKANVNLPIPLQIVAFRNSKELRQVVPLWHGKPIQAAGLFQPGQDRCFIMLDMSVENPWTVVFHEYAHELMNGTLTAEVDPWFEEGFAEYFSSIEVDGKQARVGKVPQQEYDILRQQGMMKIADLFRVQHNSATYNENGDHRTVFYAESAMMMHYLYDHALIPKLATYFTLKENKSLPVEDAIQQTFGMSAAQFDKVLRAYVSAGEYKYFAIPTPPDIVEKGYSVRPLGPYENETVIADLHLHSQDYHDKAATEFQEILKEDPNNPAAARGLGYAYLQTKDFMKAEQYFKQAAAGNSKDPRVHYYSALLMNMNWSQHSDAAEMTRELETAISLDPSFADAYMLLGYASARGGDMPKALESTKTAVSLNPRNENYRFNLAQMYLTNRQPDEGLQILEILSKSSDPMVAQRAQQSLTEVQQFKAAMEQAASGRGIASRGVAGEVNDAALASTVQAQRAAESGDDVVTIPSSDAIKFLKGTVRNVDCSSTPGATLVVDSGGTVWTMKVADTKHTLVLGADAFSCDWKKQKVAINYRETGATTGRVVSIEVQ
jgi:tetratricopeptide (TPR) repeat protein